MDSLKKKGRQYSTEYLKCGFTCSPANRRLPMCLICEKVFSNEAMKPSRLKEHFTREKLSSRRTLLSMMASESKIHHDGWLASYSIAVMIAKYGKPHSIGEDLILPATAEILETVLHQPAPTIISKIPLSRRTVQRRIDAMAQDIKATLCIIVKNTDCTTGVRALYKKERLVQELLFAKELLTDTKEHFGGCYRWSTVDAVHCILHRQHLVAKRLSACLNSSLQLFRQLCDENDEEFKRLLLHTEVRWLSKERDYSLCDNLRKSKMHIAYLADLYFKFNEMNEQLQSNELNLIKTKAVISAFISKLMFFKCNFASREFCQLPTLAKVCIVVKIPEDDVNIYCQHLQMLYEDFLKRFDDLLSLVFPSWVLDPFIVNPCNVDIYLQYELIDLQPNEEIKARMKKGYEYFWLQEEILARYPALWAAMKMLLIAIPSSSVVERGFSVVTDLVTKKRNRLEVNRSDLRLRVTSMRPNVERIVGLHAACPSE
uniref:HAT C-terminal dimerisation domain-containing protein n=1 Tax=Trichuris muris TaxID=70415 RepID=A0A5S6Q0X1_TRIMR